MLLIRESSNLNEGTSDNVFSQIKVTNSHKFHETNNADFRCKDICSLPHIHIYLNENYMIQLSASMT